MSANTNAQSSQRSTRPVFGPILTLGFATTVTVWIVAYLTHLPWINLSERVAGPVVLAVWALAAVLAGRMAPSRNSILICTSSGFLAALLGLLILGSQLVEPIDSTTPAPGTEGLVPNAPLIVAGFLALGTGLGAVGGLIGGKLRRSASGHDVSAKHWLARLAAVVCFSVVPLIVSGGGVTSAKAGMAIIGWPDSYGANMFLYPIKLMTAHPAAYFEHAHRLFGTLVGLATLSLTIYAFGVHGSRKVRLLALGLLLFVIAQGIMGGVRVRMGIPSPKGSLYWAMAHGIVAQLFFAATVAFAARVRPAFERGLALPRDTVSRPAALATWLLPAAIIQLAFGAMYRHLGSPHALWTHAAFSLAIVILASLTGFALKQRSSNVDAETRGATVRTTLRRVGGGLGHVVGMQFLLGWAALWAVGVSGDRHIPVGEEIHTAQAVPIAEALIRTAHQANGALLLALATLAFVWARWLRAAPRSQ